MNTLRLYRDRSVGSDGLMTLTRFELANVLATPFPGAAGYALRKVLLPGLFRKCGRGAQFGRGLQVLHPHKIELGDHFAIDDNGFLDARYIAPGEFVIGNRVLIARDVRIVARTDRGSISIGDDSMISRKCILASTGGIEIGSWVAVASQCVIGGGHGSKQDNNHSTQAKNKRIVIGDDCWLGAGVRVLDGVTIGQGSVIGAGAVIDRDIPEYTVAIGRQSFEIQSQNSK